MSMEYSGFQLRGNVSDREKKWSEFYSNVIGCYFDIDEKFISSVQDVLCSGKVLPHASEFANNEEVTQCAYILQSGVRDTCLAMGKFYESAVAYKNLIQMLSSKSRINICCLGSQALFAVLGVCEVIEESVRHFGFLNGEPTLVQVFIIDRNKEWRNLTEKIVASARKEYTKLKLKVDFLVSDITGGFPDEVMLRIQMAHVVAMVNHLSNLPSAETVYRITKNTLKKMKKNAYLFYLDHETNGHHTIAKNLITKSKSFSEIICSRVPKNHTKLHEDTRLFYESVYQYIYPLNLYRNSNPAPVVFSTWVKNPEAKVKLAEEDQTVKEEQTAVAEKKSPSRRYRAKSSNTLRNSKETFRLVGKLATVDMEKKNKDDSNRHRAKDVAVSRYANFDDEY